MLEFACPTCSHVEHDALEVLDEGVAHRFHCAQCTKAFTLVFGACLRCGVEVVQTSANDSQLTLKCSTCPPPTADENQDIDIFASQG